MSHSPSDVRQLRRATGVPCPVPDERAHELLDAELGAAEAAALHEHLHQCAPCRARVESVRRFMAAVRRQRRLVPHAPASLHARVRALLGGRREGEAPAAPPATDVPVARPVPRGDA